MKALTYLAVFAFLFTSACFSFSPSDYLYSSEPASTITSIKFILNGTNYELVSFGGVETFLLANSTPLNETAKIEPVMSAYSMLYIYPNQSEIDAARLALIKFNDSRNYNTSLTGKKGAEDYCEQSLTLKAMPCRNISTCYMTATLTCMRYDPGSCDVAMLANATLEFALATTALDDEVEYANSAFLSMNFNNIVGKLNDISAEVPNMRKNADAIIGSKLRYDPTCGTCYAFCPIIPIDLNALNDASAKTNTLKTKVAVISNIHKTSEQIANFTKSRLERKVNTVLSGSYGKTFTDLQAQVRNTIDSALEAQKLVYDASFNKDVSEIGELTLDIQQSISSNRFMGLNADFEQYRIITNRLNNTLKNFTEPYDSTMAIKENVSSMLIMAEWVTDRTNLEEVTQYNQLKIDEYAIGKQFKPPMSISSYRTLYYNYSTLMNETQSYMGRHVSAKNTLYWLVGNIGRASVDGVLKLTDPFMEVNYQTRKTYSSIIPPILLILTDFSLISLALVVFAGLIVRMRKYFIRRIILLGWAAVLLTFIMVLAIASLGFYSLLNSASHAATFSEFGSELSKYNESVIIIDSSNSTAGAAASLNSCAGKVALALSKLNISAVQYSIDGAVCRYGTAPTVQTTTEECWKLIGDVPVFTLAYSPKNTTPQFSVVYTKEVLVAGDARYISRCDLANVLKG
ncbi:hypothetical protein AUJ17_01255 [Candidatus Micrarchaeota archaeon CG1_02_47_40]|nr:MAG: hypothetical protein AUJ17_01255 [Candidatus Micrarchaeota archaeon CG1_02_47_40]